MTENILYILDSDSLSKNFLDEIKIKKEYSIICLNHVIEKKCKKHNLKIISEDDILSKSDYLEIDELTYNISKNWCTNNNLETYLTFHGINLGLTLQNEIFQNLSKYIHRIFLIEKGLKKIQPNTVFTTHSKDFFDSIPYEICFSRGIKTEILKELITKFRQNKFDKVNFSVNVFGKNLEFSVSHNQFSYLKKFYEFYINTRYSFMTLFEKRTKERKSILFLDFNLNWHEPFIKKYFENKFNIYCLNNRRPLLWDNNSLKIAKKFNIKKINLPKINNENKSEYFEIIKNLKHNFQNNNLNQLFTVQNFDFWKYYEAELFNICKKRFNETINVITQVEKFLGSTKIDLVWTLDDWGFDKTIINVCKMKNIPTCLFLAGGLQVLKPEGKLWPLLFAKQRIADKMFLWGENDMQNCIECGADSNKLVIGGAPRYDKTFSEKKRSEDYILILTGGFPSTQYSYFNSISFIQNFQNLFEKMLQEVMVVNKKIIVKRHPTQGPQEIIDFPEIITRIIPSAIILKNANTLELISNASLVITVQSTVLEESIILGKPIIYLPYLKGDVGIPYAKYDAVMEITNPEQLHQAIHDCLFDENTRKKLEEGRKKFLKKIISFQRNASEKHVEISLKLMKEFQSIK